MTTTRNPSTFLGAILLTIIPTVFFLVLFKSATGNGLLLLFAIPAFAAAIAGFAGWKTLFYSWLVGYVIIFVEVWIALSTQAELGEYFAFIIVTITVLIYYPITLIGQLLDRISKRNERE